MTITVVTSARPDRLHLLPEALASVAGQTRQPEMHLVGVDWAGAGGPATKNRLVAGVTTEWVAFLDDDDVLLPGHLELLEAAGSGADLVWSLCTVEGRDWAPDHRCDPGLLAHFNFIPVTYLVRTEAYRAVGGMPETDGPYDWHFLQRMLAGGARFQCLHEVTWRYRFLGGNHSLAGS